MASEYKTPISIKEAIHAINRRDYLLPAIQRKFIWRSHQICALFDSIMRGYPINTFMMWEISADNIKNEYKFYDFLKDYCERFDEENPHHPISASDDDFKAIIDGQQRLTSLYIGLCGKYAYKQPRVWWPSARDDEILPPRKLYLDLKQYLDDNDSLMKYNFQFLTEEQYKDSLEEPEEKKPHWFCLHKILEFESVDGPSNVYHKVVKPFLESAGLSKNEFAQETLSQLYDVIRGQKIIHYFNETSQEMDHVLDVFIRTNSGGTKLVFADMLMSIVVANWDGDFRQEIDNLINHIYQNTKMGFYIERDWVLKTCLMLTNADVRFKVKNFKVDQVEAIQSEWKYIKECIKNTWLLVRQFGINPQSLTSKNAVIPICYYLYKRKENGQPLYHEINDLAKFDDQRTKISLWFYMTLLKGIFGGQADTILTSMREVLKENIEKQPLFPLENIIERYKATNKDLRFDDDYIEGLLDIQHGEGRCRALLHLLFPEMNPTEVFHIDHLHPRSAFEEKNLRKHDFLNANPELMEFFKDDGHWNSIANLHLLNDSQNLNRKDKPLIYWIKESQVKLDAKDLLVEGVDLKFKNFQQFYKNRRANLKQKLENRVSISPRSLQSEPLTEELDEETAED